MKAKQEPQTYIQVFINGEENLPKEYNLYFTHCRNSYHWLSNVFNPDSKYDIQMWIQGIDWYLQPITAPAEGELLYSNPISQHQVDQNIGWRRCMEAHKGNIPDRRDELQDFLNWLDDHNFINGLAYMDNKATVDKYLKP